MSVELWILGHPPGGNVLHRMNHWQVRASRQEWRKTAWAVAQAAGPGERMARAKIDVTWRFKIKRDRDLDNLIAGLKPILDGIVDAGLLVSDSTDCIESISGRVEVTPHGQDGVLLRIEEVR